MLAAGVSVHLSGQRLTGVLSLVHGANRKVAKKVVQDLKVIWGDRFEFWIPERRPGGHNLAIGFDPPLDGFAPANALTGPARLTTRANAWVAALEDAAPALTLAWDELRTIARIVLSFDTDFDHALESVQVGPSRTGDASSACATTACGTGRGTCWRRCAGTTRPATCSAWNGR
ncbi:MAG: hypothetical protein U1F87_06230 [Kiritimatiellia bacterium]